MSIATDDNLLESGNDRNLSVTGQPSLLVQEGPVEGENNTPVAEPPRVFGDDVNSLSGGDGGEEDDESEWSETDEDEDDDDDDDDDYYYEEEEDEEDDYEEEEDEDDEEDEVEGEDNELAEETPRVFGDNMIDLPESGGGDEEDDGVKQRRIAGDGGEVVSSPEMSECKIGEIEGLSCPICMDAWTSGGDHHICCLPCGHLYGMSCINKWLQHKRSSGRCPQCIARCGLKDVRKLYPQRIVVMDEDMQKKIRRLESRCKELETMVTLVPKRDYHDAHFTSMNGRFDKFDAMQTDLYRGLRGISDQIDYTGQCITALFRHLKIQLPDRPRYPPSDVEGQ